MDDTPLVFVSVDNQSVAENFAEWFKTWSNKQSGARITIALSGGSTPKVLFQALAEKYAEDIPWHKIHFFWGDERCVAPTHDDSNYKMTKTLLLDPINFPENQVHRVKGEIDPEVAAEDYERQIRLHLEEKEAWPAFDLIILGMGSDGHTASIFPHQMELLESDRICAVATHPDSGQKRVSLTGKVLNNAHQVCFLVTGDSKKEKIVEIFNEQGQYQAYPAFHIRPVHGALSWHIDKAAAALLK